MKNLWAPWRIHYLLGHQEKGCIFCKYPKQSKKKDKANLILWRGEHTFIILNKYPYSNGHLMVVPYRHTNELGGLSTEENQELMAFSGLCTRLLKKAVYAQGCNVGMNLGLAAGAGIKEHLHMHVVPRWLGDTNFMPIFKGDRVIVEYLTKTYDRLLRALKKIV
ncbi:MAG: HIT domain-containing protein [Deltaproteobacteria bacterium]|nr:HIT domain-containing protein [Deltaproteobacteria bacterium]